MLLIGDRLPYVTALMSVTGSADESKKAAESAVKSANRELADFERIRKFKILDREFSIEHGELTPTMKLRRGRARKSPRLGEGDVRRARCGIELN